METKEQIFYKKVYIHSEDDLPKEAGFYFVNWTPGHTHNTTMRVVYYDESIKGLWFGKGWYDWYLLPVTLPSNKEIEKELLDRFGFIDEGVDAENQFKIFSFMTWFKSRLTEE